MPADPATASLHRFFFVKTRSFSSPKISLRSRPLAAWPQRCVHLDFHTSPFISDVACEFDANAFADTFVRAHVNSVTVFARCHHGLGYYPSQLVPMHPALKGRDLLGEMVTALHRAGIRAPIYTTVAWDEEMVRLHPEWRMVKADGTFARVPNARPDMPAHPGGWWFLDWMNPGYQAYLEAHTRELCEHYAVDGLFYDILFYHPFAHHSDSAWEFRKKHGYGREDLETFQRFQAHAQAEFTKKFSALVRRRTKDATVFFNSDFQLMVDGTGGRQRAASYSHIEIESLPSGFWGYHHYPRLARGAGRWGKAWLGMTGRFQQMWGDFGGVRPVPALEYDCFRSQALGGGNSVGDQLPPRGTLDPAAYALIGEVYAQCAAAEPFYAGSESIRHVGIVTANHPAKPAARTNLSDEGALMMAEEMHYDATLVDDRDDLSAYALLVLPDETVITPRLAKALAKYHARGGKLILSYRTGFDPQGKWALDFLPIEVGADVERFPTYWRARETFWPEMARSERVVYSAGVELTAGRGTEVLADRVLPYFRRTDLRFSSHFQTPPMARVAKSPAVVAGKDFVFFADPIFREYREQGNVMLRDGWKRAVRRLIGDAPFGEGLPTTVNCVPARRGNDLLLTLLHYVPVRKATGADVLEERMGFAGESLRLPAVAKEVRVFGTEMRLSRDDATGAFGLPVTKGRLLLTVPDFFRRTARGAAGR